MKKLGLLSFLSVLLFCFNSQNANAMGLFYTNVDYPVTATGAPVTDLHNLKKGKSDSINVLGVVEVGDAGIESAAKAGNIKKIAFIDVNEMTVFFFFRRVTTTVYGE